MIAWQKMPLVNRVRLLRYGLPIAIIIIVIFYQLAIARSIETWYGHNVHYTVEIAFYSVVGPLVTWLTLNWIERKMIEKETLEKQVLAQSQQIASLADTSADGIISLDGNGHIVSWNQGAENIFGYSEEEICDQPLEKLLSDTKVLKENLTRYGKVQNYETTAIAKNGQEISVNLTQTQLEDKAQDLPVSLIILRDITTRRERESILEEERARIARDLHDGVAQTLYFLALKADMAQRQVDTEPNEVKEELVAMGSETRNVIREVRRTIFALRPLDWPEGEFLSAIKTFTESFAEQVSWQIEFENPGKLMIPVRLEPTIFRLIQESLNNVAKHADADHVWIKITVEGKSTLLLSITDDGVGFSAETSQNGGLGLRQMQQRVEALGGDFNLETTPEKGTIVSARIPMPGDENEKN